jgi:hypothetical protein
MYDHCHVDGAELINSCPSHLRYAGWRNDYHRIEPINNNVLALLSDARIRHTSFYSTIEPSLAMTRTTGPDCSLMSRQIDLEAIILNLILQ